MVRSPSKASEEAVYDVVVVGGGGSGLAAALSAATAGARTLLLEKNPAVGGSTGMSIGSITATGTRFQKAQGIVDTPDEHFADMSKFLGEIDDRENKELRRILVDNVPETLEWLMSLGLCFFGPMPEPPHTKPRMHNVLPNSRAYPYVLSKACRKAGVTILTNARVKGLVKDGEKVVGVDALLDGKPARFVARGGVILTTGDFSASGEYKQRFLPHVTHINALNPSNTGDGQQMGEAVGGSVLNGDVLWGPSLRFAPGKADNLVRRLPAWPWLTKCMELALTKLPASLFRPFILSFMTSTLAPEPSLLRAGAILVSREGRRFADELARPELEIPKQSQKQAYIVFDDVLAEKFNAWPNFVSTAPGIAYAYVSDYQKQKGLYATGKTVADLAAAIGVPAENLQATVDSYGNELKSTSGDARAPISRGPFHAIGPVSSWVVLTEGGLAVTARHEVVDQSGKAIEGLYAAGSAGQGGLVLAGHGHHLGWAFTSGRRAGRFAAERAAAT